MDYNEKQNAGNASTSGMKTEEYVAENSDAILERVKEYCRERMTEAVYDFYIKDLKVTGVTRYMTITLVVRSKFTLAVVSDRYGKMLEEAFEAVLGTAVHLQFETALEAEGKNERVLIFSLAYHNLKAPRSFDAGFYQWR